MAPSLPIREAVTILARHLGEVGAIAALLHDLSAGRIPSHADQLIATSGARWPEAGQDCAVPQRFWSYGWRAGDWTDERRRTFRDRSGIVRELPPTFVHHKADWTRGDFSVTTQHGPRLDVVRVAGARVGLAQFRALCSKLALPSGLKPSHDELVDWCMAFILNTGIFGIDGTWDVFKLVPDHHGLARDTALVPALREAKARIGVGSRKRGKQRGGTP